MRPSKLREHTSQTVYAGFNYGPIIHPELNGSMFSRSKSEKSGRFADGAEDARSSRSAGRRVASLGGGGFERGTGPAAQRSAGERPSLVRATDGVHAMRWAGMAEGGTIDASRAFMSESGVGGAEALVVPDSQRPITAARVVIISPAQAISLGARRIRKTKR